MHALISAWNAFRTDRAPYLLPGDEAVVGTDGLACRFNDWDTFVANPNFGAPGNSRLHLDLLPMPFVGNLKTASVFLLMLNPGFGPHDYYGEYRVPEYRLALEKNLCQHKDRDFFSLDPQFSWHGGFEYWHTKLSALIAALAERAGISYGQARRFFQQQIAAIELVPYHSINFALPDRVLKQLRSVQLARAYVHDELVPRARAGECLLVVTRAVNRWQLPRHRNIVTYTGSEARSAHLTPGSRGGAAMLKFLYGRHEGGKP